MPSIERPLSGDVLLLNLEDERRQCSDPAPLERSGRNARTLVKDGSLRVTMIVLAPGGSIAEHHAEGPITVQPLHGRIRFMADANTYDVGPLELLSLRPGVSHSVSSEDGATFLLTVSLPG